MTNTSVFLQELLESQAELNAFYDSEQYHLSLKIIDIISSKCMTDEQIMDFLNIDLCYFVRLTSGDITIAIDDYNLIISKLNLL